LFGYVTIKYNIINISGKGAIYVVDDVQRESGDDYEPGGRAGLPGQTAAIEFGSKKNEKLVSYEFGHNLGLEHQKAPSNLMTPTSSGKSLTDQQRKQIFRGISGMQDGSHHIGGRIVAVVFFGCTPKEQHSAASQVTRIDQPNYLWLQKLSDNKIIAVNNKSLLQL
jgi:hypothetical protein